MTTASSMPPETQAAVLAALSARTRAWLDQHPKDLLQWPGDLPTELQVAFVQWQRALIPDYDPEDESVDDLVADVWNEAMATLEARGAGLMQRDITIGGACVRLTLDADAARTYHGLLNAHGCTVTLSRRETSALLAFLWGAEVVTP